MGVLYSLFPVTTSSPDYSFEELSSWLMEHGVDLPRSKATGRYPTVREIRAALESIEHLTIGYDQDAYSSWWATVSLVDGDDEKWTSVRVLHFDGDEDHSVDCYFEKGWSDLIVLITERLARSCGPLILTAHSDLVPVLIEAGMDPDEVWARWLS